MAIVSNCVLVTCDLCARSEYYTSYNYAENCGWDINVKIPYGSDMDLCPKCSDKLSKVIYKFIQGETDEPDKSI